VQHKVGQPYQGAISERVVKPLRESERSVILVAGRRREPPLVLRDSIVQVYSKYTRPTSVHIPKPLLVAVDRRARALNISRNRLIVQALEREVTEGSNWSVNFFGQLESPETGVEDAADEMLKAIRSQRRSKKPVRL